MNKIKLIVFILSIQIPYFLLSQTNREIAIATYQLAQEEYDKGDYKKALDYLYKVELQDSASRVKASYLISKSIENGYLFKENIKNDAYTVCLEKINYYLTNGKDEFKRQELLKLKIKIENSENYKSFRIIKLDKRVNDEILLTYSNGLKVSTNNFIYVFNQNKAKDCSTLNDFINLFVLFNMKVMEAEELKMDKDSSFIKELEGYAKQLKAPYKHSTTNTPYTDEELKNVPEYISLLNEYRKGILLYNLTDQMVWSKAVKDKTGLHHFYNGNITEYKAKQIQENDKIVLEDYQKVIEQEWVKKLKDKYPYNVDSKILEQLLLNCNTK